jgi:hypothetical protein
MTAPSATADELPTPFLAYYYIWFDPGSWDRAKVDYPLLGRYSSDDRSVMTQHIHWAKQAGIDGFIVSWKSTPVLNRRLEKLIQVAAEEDFKLAIIYQGLDFYRNPQPVERIEADLDEFILDYSSSTVFDLFERPLVILSGTWEFTLEDIARIGGPRRDHIMLLASEKRTADYERLSRLVDGNAYYWSSVDPETFPGYPLKLEELGARIHADGGLWIAPAAPGFDARMIGGVREVTRDDGNTLRQQVAGALASNPDAVGLISWNEFTENTHLEPSLAHGKAYLEVLRQLSSGGAPPVLEFDSSNPPATDPSYGLPILVGIGGLFVTGAAVFVVRLLGAKRHNPASLRPNH